MVGALGGALAGQLVVLAQKGRQAPRRNGAAIGETNLAITAEGALAINVESAECPHLSDTGAQAADGGRETEPAAPAPAKAKKAATGRNGANAPRKARTSTKQAHVVEMLRRSEGATVDQIMEATGWQRHTVRGAFAGALKKKLGLTVTSEKVEGRGRVYRVAG